MVDRNNWDKLRFAPAQPDDGGWAAPPSRTDPPAWPPQAGHGTQNRAGSATSSGTTPAGHGIPAHPHGGQSHGYASPYPAYRAPGGNGGGFLADPYADPAPHADPAGRYADLIGRYEPAIGSDPARGNGYDPAQGTGYGGRPSARSSRRPIRARRLDASPWHWLLFLPIVVALWTPLYNRVEPTLGGVPFFYWGQLAFAILATVVVTIVHLATKDR
jgi:hypothetical protein